jgi:hypothetical protein
MANEQEPTDNFNYDLFISHADLDAAAVEPLVAWLKTQGLRVWYSTTDREFGASFPQEIEAALDQSRRVLICWSHNYNASKWCRKESDIALATHKPLLCLSLDDTPLRGMFRHTNYISWHDKDAPQRLLGAAGVSFTDESHASATYPAFRDSHSKPHIRSQFP